MMSLIPCAVPHLVVVEATGLVVAEDYRTVLIPALKKQNGPIRLVYILDTDVAQYTAKILWEDAEVGLQRLFHWQKIALVCADERLEESVAFFGHFLPGDWRSFPRNHLEDALEWAAA
ncbi:STAS/SEC14 domain-containing protein [Snodgrassella sp. CFCC 13594]|uniref:STAS/SEC14 domain-containing protein n=1 Tax=Snodgrassella sp. CFCC 13594 TaxID=1775559 RepID=UPI00082A0F0B|nr:STAS/SEC14 domain-containing protein [Snodgrassella sp. CFCC 13594]